MTGLAVNERATVDKNTPGDRRQLVNDRLDRYNAAAVAGYTVAGVGITTFLIWTFWPKGQEQGSVPRAFVADAPVRLMVNF
jgi:hypothetical protein